MTKEEMQVLAEMVKSAVKEEVTPLREDISSLDKRVSGLESDMSGLKSDMASIKSDVAKLNHDLVPKVNAMYDCVKGIQDRFDRQDRLEEKVEGHDHRIYALEEARRAEAKQA